MRQCEHNMIISGGQKFRYPVVEPFFLGHGLTFGAVTVSTRIIGVALIIAVGAKVNMTTQSSGPAGYDPIHDLYLFMGGVKSFQKALSRVPEDVGDVMFWPAALAAASGVHLSTISAGLTTCDMASLLM